MDIRQLFTKTVIIYQHLHKNDLKKISHTYSTRAVIQNLAYIPKAEKIILQRNYTYLGPKLYNKVPAEIKNENKYSTFKTKLKLWLLEKPRSEIHTWSDPRNLI